MSSVFYTYEDLLQKIEEIEAKIGHTFSDKSLLISACTHCSYMNEHKNHVGGHNERLEFLGDSVLNLIVSTYLYDELKNSPEGELSYLRAQIVSASSCAKFLQHLELQKYLLVGKGEQIHQGRGQVSLLCDFFEAILGAYFLDTNFETVQHFFITTFSNMLLKILKTPEKNWKALLQEAIQKKYNEIPQYKILLEEGPDHEKTFEVQVIVQNREFGRGRGSSKKTAEQEAAQKALVMLDPKHSLE